MMTQSNFRILLLAAACALAGCQTTVPEPVVPLLPPPVSEPPMPLLDPVVVKEKALADAIGLYGDGRYEEAVAALAPLAVAPELSMGSQVRAFKYLAFSNCANGNLRSCRSAFDSALALDATFQLTDAERGHPVWGREFSRARSALTSKRRSLSPIAR